MAVLADMLVRMGVDSAELRKGLKTAQSNLKQFTRDVGGMKRALQGAFAATGIGVAAAAFAKFVKGGAESADTIGKLSQKVGISTEDLSRLGYAASLSGSNLEGLTTGLRQLAKNMGEAAGGSKEYAAVFDAIGVKVTDSTGKLRPLGGMLREVADKFSRMEDGAGKAALAQELFGRSGLEMIPLLNQGTEGLAKMAAEADSLGVTVSGPASKSAEAFNDALERLGTTKEGLARLVAERLTPMMTRLATEFANTASSSGALKEAADVLAAGVKVLVSVGVALAAAFNVAGKSIAAVAAALVAAAQGDFRRAWEILKDGSGDVADTITAAMDRIEATWSSGAASIEATAPATATKIAAPVVKAAAKIKEESQKVKAAIYALVDEAADAYSAVEIAMAGTDSDHLAASMAYADEVKRAGEALDESKRKAEEFADVGVGAFFEMARAAGRGANAIANFWRNLADQILEQIQRMVTAWVSSQLVSSFAGGGGLGGLITGAVGGGVQAPVEIGPGKFTPGVAPSNLSPAPSASSGAVSVSLYVQGDVVDPQGWFAKNEGALAAAVSSAIYKGRI